MTSKDRSYRGRPRPCSDFRLDRSRKAKIACFSFFAGNQERNQPRKSIRLFNSQRSCWIVA